MTESGEDRRSHRLVLASSSPSRLRVLRDAGFDPYVVASGAPEDDEGDTVADTTRMLAERKGRSVVATILAAGATPRSASGTVVLACDSLLELAGKACGKPGTTEAFLEQWRSQSGADAVLYTGHFLCDMATGREVGEVVGTGVRFGRPSREELEAYAATGEPLQLAGACSLEGIGAPFIESITGDPSNVQGLSLPALRRMLIVLGYSVTDFWRSDLR